MAFTIIRSYPDGSFHPHMLFLEQKKYRDIFTPCSGACYSSRQPSAEISPLYPLEADQTATVSVMEIQAGFSAGTRAGPVKNAWESHQSTLAADMQGESDE